MKMIVVADMKKRLSKPDLLLVLGLVAGGGILMTTYVQAETRTPAETSQAQDVADSCIELWAQAQACGATTDTDHNPTRSTSRMDLVIQSSHVNFNQPVGDYPKYSNDNLLVKARDLNINTSFYGVDLDLKLNSEDQPIVKVDLGKKWDMILPLNNDDTILFSTGTRW